MNSEPENKLASGDHSPSDMGLRSRVWKRFIQGPDSDVLQALYLPGLSMARFYDRCCAYFSSTVLAAAARGFGPFIQQLIALGDQAPRPAIRFVVNEELTPQDLKVLLETGDIKVLERQLLQRFKTPQEALVRDRLAMLAWLVAGEYLEIKVGIMRQGGGIVHGKFGIITDASQDAVVFRGSGNESGSALLYNYENLEVSTSWQDEEAYLFYNDQFNRIWEGTHPDVAIYSLPEAVRLELIKLAPQEAPYQEPGLTPSRARVTMQWQYLLEAPYLHNGVTACDATAPVEMWPHQGYVVEEVAGAWPQGRLLCDEVGLGKTIEASLALRRLLAGRGVKRVLILLPANLLPQWQAELREKAGLIFPRLQGTTKLHWPNGESRAISGLSEALEEDYLLLSRETARLPANAAILMEAQPWDLVILDEAHAARRAEQEEGQFNAATQLLRLLRQLQLRQKARGFIFLSATPMQTHPWEPWDLLAVLGEGDYWLSDFSNVRDYFSALGGLKKGYLEDYTAWRAARVINADRSFPEWPGLPVPADMETVSETLLFAGEGKRSQLIRWMRKGSPLGRRMHRNTRRTLARYYEMGLLAQTPPSRRVDDVDFDYQDHEEREVYEAITRYIDKRFAELEAEKRGKGFVMTVYRRRMASSPRALQLSLERRAAGLLRVINLAAVQEYLDEQVEELDSRDLDDIGINETGERVSAAFPDDPEVARAEYREVKILLDRLEKLQGQDSRRDKFFELWRRVSDDGRPVLVFTGYTDTMEYISEHLVSTLGNKVATYSGKGGQRWNGNHWENIGKEKVSAALAAGEIKVMVCTDAASEGLNLQAAGAIINYDLPWNPSKVEQRIGRIDRIGQKYPEILVINLFLQDSVDQQVYKALRQRCDIFRTFVGPMQPVLAQASRLLLQQEKAAPETINELLSQYQAGDVEEENYLESEAMPIQSHAIVSKKDIVEALQDLAGVDGFNIKCDENLSWFQISLSQDESITLALNAEALQMDDNACPWIPGDSKLEVILQQLNKGLNRLPLVIASQARGSFRASEMRWVDSSGMIQEVPDMASLRQLLQDWDGRDPNPDDWHQARTIASQAAWERVNVMEATAAQIQAESLVAQQEAARLRLQNELGRYLVCLEGGAGDLNHLFYEQMSRQDIESRKRLQRVFRQLGDYPVWSNEQLKELYVFAAGLSDNQKRARLLGSELDAALNDPRWEALRR